MPFSSIFEAAFGEEIRRNCRYPPCDLPVPKKDNKEE
jgi:hypothetical protein